MTWQVIQGVARDPAFPGFGSFAHGITSRSLGDQRPEPRRWSPPGLRALVLAEQIHGARIAWIGRRVPRSFVSGTDGLLTSEPGVALGIFVADCVPVLFAWPGKRMTGAVHAGWRGLSAGIIRKTCRILTRRSGRKNLQGLRVAIGPHIRSCCYRVGEDVARVFPDSVTFRDGGSDRVALSLAAEVKKQLLDCGLGSRAVSEAPFCTMEDPRFFSHRRDHDSRRMLAWIVRR
jgi:YfiH family protein